MGRTGDQLAKQKTPITMEEYRRRNGISRTPVIRCQFLGFNSPRSAPVQMFGWHGPAKTRIIEGKYLCPEGEITHRFALEILEDGYCEIPYTQYNVEKLKKCIEPHVEQHERSKAYRDADGIVRYKKTPYTKEEPASFKLLDAIDLDKPAPINDTNIGKVNVFDDLQKENEALKEKLKQLEDGRKARKVKSESASPAPAPME